MKKTRILALALAVVMAVSLLAALPLSAAAAEPTQRYSRFIFFWRASARTAPRQRACASSGTSTSSGMSSNRAFMVSAA